MAKATIQIEKSTVVTESESQYELSITDLFNDINESLGMGVVRDDDIIKGIKIYINELDDDRTLAKLTLVLLNRLENSVKYDGDLDAVYMAALRAGKQVIKYLAD